MTPIRLLSREECAAIISNPTCPADVATLARNNLLLVRMVGLVRAFMDHDPDTRQRYGLALLELLAHFPPSASLRWGEESQKAPPPKGVCSVCRRTKVVEGGKVARHLENPGKPPNRYCAGSGKEPVALDNSE